MASTSHSRLARKAILSCAVAALTLSAAPARAASCGNGPEGFPAWLAEFKQEAVSRGISRSVVDRALAGVHYDPKIIARDRGQGIFHQSFSQFSGKLLSPSRVARGRSLMRSHAALLRSIENQYGVPGGVLVAIWGLETSFGADNGHFPILSSVATLAYDCRRSEHFRQELMAAVEIVQRGYMSPSQMVGDWAGEIGQTQFMPTNYLAYGVGRRDLIHNTGDALASTANFLRQKGWRAGAGWDEGEPNFPVLLEWNQARVYTQTVAAFADELQGRPRGQPAAAPANNGGGGFNFFPW